MSLVIVNASDSYCASYNTFKERWRITSNGDDIKDGNDNNKKTLIK